MPRFAGCHWFYQCERSSCAAIQRRYFYATGASSKVAEVIKVGQSRSLPVNAILPCKNRVTAYPILTNDVSYFKAPWNLQDENFGKFCSRLTHVGTYQRPGKDRSSVRTGKSQWHTEIQPSFVIEELHKLKHTSGVPPPTAPSSLAPVLRGGLGERQRLEPSHVA